MTVLRMTRAGVIGFLIVMGCCVGRCRATGPAGPVYDHGTQLFKTGGVVISSNPVTADVQREFEEVYRDLKHLFTTALGYAVLNQSNVFTATNSFNATTRIAGTQTSDNARTGDYGEYISSIAATISVGSSGTYYDLVSITLSSGDWDLAGQVCVIPNGATITSSNMGIGQFAGTNVSGLNTGDSAMGIIPPISTNISCATVASLRFPILSGTSIFYLKNIVTYSVATPMGYGRLSARRMR